MRVQLALALAGACLAALAGCSASPAASPAATNPAPPSTPAPVRTSAADGQPATGSGAQNRDRAPSSTPSVGGPAERFAACLKAHGVDAIAVDGEVFRSAAGSSGGVAVGNAPGPNGQTAMPQSPAETECFRLVPDYHDPDKNQR